MSPEEPSEATEVILWQNKTQASTRGWQGEHFAIVYNITYTLCITRCITQCEPVLPVHVLLHIARHVKVDDVFHIGDVKTSRRYCCCNNDWRLTNLEPGKGFKLQFCGKKHQNLIKYMY